MELRPYQVEAKKAVYREWKDKNSTLLVLPTGCGKTIVFASIAQERVENGRVLILAHREELLSQAADKIHASFGLDCAVEKADQTCIDSDEQIVVGSVQTMMTEKRLSRFTHDYFHTVIVDEAHHALANSYQNILTYFDKAKVLGVTATPDRGDMQELSATFESLAYEYSLRDAVEQGYLSKIYAHTIPLNIDLSSVKVSCGDFQVNDIGAALEPYLEDIATEMAKVCMDKHTVVFLPLVKISQQFRDILNRHGFRAAEVNGESKDRDVILKEFEEGKFNVLCNSMLLTEGWDCPIVDCIVVLRPTKVRSLYCQMVGRGTRLYPGKDHLTILDFLWMTGRHDLVHPADIICKKKDVAKSVTEKLEDGQEESLFDAENDVLEQRKNALLKSLAEKAAKEARKQKKVINPLYFKVATCDNSLIDYVPTFGWEKEPATEGQISTLTKFGINGEKLTKGEASRLIDKAISRSKQNLATAGMLNQLVIHGYRHPELFTFEEGKKIMGALAAVQWQNFRLPKALKPENYVPQAMRGVVEWT